MIVLLSVEFPFSCGLSRTAASIMLEVLICNRIFSLPVCSSSGSFITKVARRIWRLFISLCEHSSVSLTIEWSNGWRHLWVSECVMCTAGKASLIWFHIRGWLNMSPCSLFNSKFYLLLAMTHQLMVCLLSLCNHKPIFLKGFAISYIAVCFQKKKWYYYLCYFTFLTVI